MSISVDKENDTLTSLIDRINLSGAGVTASFDESANRIQFVSDSDSEDLIGIDNDTTGFLTAAKLDTKNTGRGNVRDDQQVLSKTSQFADVNTGSFSINGHQITIDVDQDTVEHLVAKINGANAGVTASYETGTDRLKLEATAIGADLIDITNDSTGFLAAAGLDASNTIRGKLADNETVLADLSQFAGVASGSFSINGISIAVDASNDTVQSLIGKINDSGAGVTATYDTQADKVILTPTNGNSAVTLEGDTSGFLTAAKLANRVNPNAAFNGTGANAALFDPDRSVHAGSFKLNGVTIDVTDSDSVNSVLAQITSSVAGVTAAFDDNTQTIQLTSKDKTSSPIVTVDDTSGFLSAVKLDGTVHSTVGAKPIYAFDSALADIPEYSNVHAGRITVNGYDIDIDPATTTVHDLVSSLNGIPGILATLDAKTGKLRISSKRVSTPITLSDTSGVLSPLGLKSGTVRGSSGKKQVVETSNGYTTTSNASEVATTVSSAAETLNQMLSQLGKIAEFSPQFHSDLEASIRETVNSLSDAGITGISIVGSGAGSRIGVDSASLANSLAPNGTSLIDQPAQRLDSLLYKFTQQIGGIAAPASSSEVSTLLLQNLRVSNTPNSFLFKRASDAYSGW